ncbi:hypothetical protein MTO96_007370 [Rhipicephalus appendiculatus]
MDVMLEMAIKWDINFLFSLEAVDSQATGKVLVFRKPRIIAAWVDRLENTVGSIEYARHVQTHLRILNASSSVNYSMLMELERSFTQVLLRASRQTVLDDTEQVRQHSSLARNEHLAKVHPH